MSQRERTDMTGMPLSEQIKLVELGRYVGQCEARIRDLEGEVAHRGDRLLALWDRIRDLENELAIARAKERP